MANLLMMGAAIVTLVSLGAAGAEAQTRPLGGSQIVPISHGGGGPRIVPLSNGGHFQNGSHFGRTFGGGRFGGGRGRGHFPGFIIVERPFGYAQDRRVPVIVEREVVVREVAVVVQPVTPPPPRKPYVIGKSYASLPPQGCMKLIEAGASYYFCGGGEWYKQTGKLYQAVARKL